MRTSIPRKGHPSIVQLLLNNGALELADHFGVTPLHKAVAFGHEDVVQVLLRHGTAVETQLGESHSLKGSHGTALHVASWKNHARIVRLLLTEGHADVHALDEWACTPLHSAAKSGSEAVVRVLLENGADPEFRNSERLTPRDVAANAKVRRLLGDASEGVLQPKSLHGH